ncbi:MAG: hypothetical protein C0436_00075 [Alphaproteobacteria bacterium]|nr:hypothetical protein [Alphaproteobacteria bacterium]
MITVSPGLKAEIQKLRGRRLQARVRIDYSDVNLDNTIQGTASSTAENTYITQTYNEKEDVSFKFASLDGSWVLGEYALAPVTRSEQERLEIGWWSAKQTNANADYPYTTGRLYGDGRLYGENVYGELATPEELKITFTKRTISEINISFDNARMEYAVDFDVVLYNIDGIELYRKSVIGNGGVKYNASIPAQSLVASLSLFIYTWSHAGRQAKVAEFYTSVFELYNGDDILSIDVIENRELSGMSPIGSVASGRCVVSLYNRDRRFDYDNTTSKLFGLIRENVRIVPEIGDGTEWIPLGVYYAKAWDISKQSITATVTGVDRVALLGESEYRKSEIITAPDDTLYLIDTNAEWLAGTSNNVTVSGNTITL